MMSISHLMAMLSKSSSATSAPWSAHEIHLPLPVPCWPRLLQKNSLKPFQKAADVWKKDVWDFQWLSQTFFELRFSLGKAGKDSKNLSSQTWPGSPRRLSPRHSRPPDLFLFWKIQRGAHKRGLKPQIFRENRGEILPGKSGLFGANWRHFRAGRGLFGADRDQFLCTPQPRGKSRNCPERALFGPIGPFRAKPPFAKPPFGFPRPLYNDCNGQIVGQPRIGECRQNVRKCPKNVQKLSKNCAEGLKTQFSDNFCLFGRCFCLVTLSNARLLQYHDIEMARRFATRIDSQRKPYFHNGLRRFAHELPQTCDSQLLAPRSADHKKKGLSSGAQNRFARIRRFAQICESMRANRTI